MMLSQSPIILLVDDNPDLLELLRRLLVTFVHHAEVVAVVSGAAALAVLAVRPVALVIADYHMPEMNGLELLNAIRAVSPATRVAIASVDDRHQVLRQIKAAAAEYILAKPFQLAQLKQMIAESIPLDHP
jgi:CheY-like chemotaxis protein